MTAEVSREHNNSEYLYHNVMIEFQSKLVKVVVWQVLDVYGSTRILVHATYFEFDVQFSYMDSPPLGVFSVTLISEEPCVDCHHHYHHYYQQ